MAADKDYQRRKLFSLFSANLSLFEPQNAGMFRCPVCEYLFDESALVEPLKVNLAHTYPKVCGGREKTLTCIICNGRFSDDDQQLNRRKIFDEAMSGIGFVNGRVYIDKYDIGVKVLKHNSAGAPIELVPDLARTDKRKSDAIGAMFKINQAPPEHGLTVKFDRASNPSRVTMSLLNSAYLSLFHSFGYEYFRDPGSAEVRRYLNLKEVPQGVPYVMINLTGSDERIAHSHQRGFAMLDGKFKCLITVVYNPVGLCLALMPGFGEEGKRDYTNILEISTRRGPKHLDCFYPNIERDKLCSPEFVGVITKNWHRWTPRPQKV
jgi:hypothetical protein